MHVNVCMYVPTIMCVGLAKATCKNNMLVRFDKDAPACNAICM